MKISQKVGSNNISINKTLNNFITYTNNICQFITNNNINNNYYIVKYSD